MKYIQRKFRTLVLLAGALIADLGYRFRHTFIGRLTHDAAHPRMADPSFMPKTYEKDGGDTQVIASGGKIEIETGGILSFNGVDQTSKLAAAVADPVAGAAASYKIARGVHTQVAAQDTVATGLATVVAVVANFDSVGPTVKQMFLSAGIGNQAGAPVAGSVYINTYKPTSNVNDSTPTAATDFTDNVKIAWVAIGT